MRSMGGVERRETVLAQQPERRTSLINYENRFGILLVWSRKAG